MKATTNKLFINIAFLGMILAVFHYLGKSANPPPSPGSQSQCELVILADPYDPYYALAEEIAASENVPIFHRLTEALSCQPIFLNCI